MGRSRRERSAERADDGGGNGDCWGRGGIVEGAAYVVELECKALAVGRDPWDRQIRRRRDWRMVRLMNEFRKFDLSPPPGENVRNARPIELSTPFFGTAFE